MAVNPRHNLPNKNTLYLAVSGGGKSQALKQNRAIPKSGVRVILWDQAHDHAAHHYETKSGFLRALRAGIASGRGFRVAFSGGSSVDDFEWFCVVVWACLDGTHLTYVIAEELSQVCPSAAKATRNASILLNQGRKYGMRFHGTSQKPQEVAKTFYDQCEIKYIGPQLGANVQRFSREFGIDEAEIKALEDLEFFIVDRRSIVKKRLKYKKSNKK